LVLTGAGISADSGVPTFRGTDGLWSKHRPEELATPEAFKRDPRLVWEWYGWRREIVGSCRPNAAHLALARWAAATPQVHIVTQNVDGLHVAAAAQITQPMDRDLPTGSPEDPRLIELHGSLFRSRCTGCGGSYESREPIDASSEASLPNCTSCCALLRPDVVWFGEPLDHRLLALSFELAKSSDACLVIGTSALVQPAASLAATSVETGGALIEVNPERTPLTDSAAVSFRARGVEVVPALIE
jgi:NAD-dependent deacetylase